LAIAISAGTTTYALAQRLVDIPHLDGRHELDPRRRRPSSFRASVDQTVILTGGVRTPSEALVGPFAVAALRTVHVDLVFVGVHGMDPHTGFTCPNLLEAETDRALVEAGDGSSSSPITRSGG
jgi:DeoR/GlpR family transcriptional regulator of sugar metabolism